MLKAVLVLWISVTLLFLGWRLWFFLRNPERIPPPGDDFLSPADGFVVYVKRVENGMVPMAVKQRTDIPLEEITACMAPGQQSGLLIGIYMTAFSVHHNRSPISGSIARVVRVSADRNKTMARMFSNLLTGRKPYEENCSYIIENDRVTMVIDTNRGSFTVTQIADKWISHIVNHCQQGQTLGRGERFGLIRFGSQVDVFLPDNLGFTPQVHTGEYVYAGQSILATKSITS